MSRKQSLLSATQFQKQWSSLLSAALESWAHQLLYVRHVYPRETFGGSSFLGVRCHVSRHPGVVSYITNTLKVAVPSLLTGVADEISLTIFDNDDENTVLDKYVLRFSGEQINGVSSDGKIPEETVQQLERGMRDLVLSAHALESGRATLSESVSFKLSLHIPEEDRTCAALNEAFAVGTWFAPRSNSEVGDEAIPRSRGRVIRPLHHVSNASIGSIQFVMQKSREDNRKKPPPS
jgi:HORMA domain